MTPITIFRTVILSLTTALFFSLSPITPPGSDMTVVKGGLLNTTDPVTHTARQVTLKPFQLDKDLVTVDQFEAFATATQYVTEAEKFGNAGVFDFQEKGWALINGANFRYPFGRNKPRAAGNHPVTQVSWNDANAYARWKGKRLPTQWEWEHAARNAEQSQQEYTWGNDLVVNGIYKANTWQGSFPGYNTAEDGYTGTSPVSIFGRNKLGLGDMGGNVWQWCQDSIGPTPQEAATDPAMRRVTRGGSFLCDPMVCHGFRVLGRSSSTPESSMVHIGFRCAKDI